jgi:hypothetical protein
MEDLNKNTESFGVSLAVTSILSALLVVIKESSEPVLNLMKTLTGHHWATHGLFTIIVFIALGVYFGKVNNGQGLKLTPERLTMFITAAVVISGLIIAGFYLFMG